MKKCLFFLSLLGICFALTACQSQANASSTASGSAETGTEEVKAVESCASDDTTEPTLTEASGEVHELTAGQYDQMVAHYKENPRRYVGYRPCIVDFYATWCGPCKKLAPIMEKLAKKYKGQISFYKVDVDKQEELSGTYGIQSIPTVFFCANGEIRSQVGLLPEEALEEIISELLSAPMK
ncbi:MAG: thioredoxin [Bacteroidaceae bacterium]|nr:thioredoxin [Bacteroidaceae bacterium]